MGKPHAGVYRDEPDRAETASLSSAVSLHEYNDAEHDSDELPAYTDVPDIEHTPAAVSFHVHPSIPQSTLSADHSTLSTHYFYDAESLETMIRTQSNYPPTYTMRIHGTHTETHKTRDNKTEKKVVTDFDIKLNMTHLIISDDHYVEIIEEGQKGYRGTVFKSTSPHHDVETGGLTAWCEDYISNPSKVKTFTLNRIVRSHDTALLSTLVQQLVDSTSYRGHTKVSFPMANAKIVVYSQCRINSLRFNPYLKWFFYLTFLWIFAWPTLIFLTKRYEPITAVFPYRRQPRGAPSVPGQGAPVVQSEHAFFELWKASLQRAVLGQHQGWVDEVYMAETIELARVGGGTAAVQSTSSAFLQGAIGGIVRIATGRQIGMGWGADS